MPWGAVIGAGVGLIGASMQSNAASNAAQAQQQAAANATAEQQREFNVVQGEYAPQRNLGYSAMDQLAQLYGFANPQTGAGAGKGGSGGGLNPAAPNYAGFYNSPGYQFTLGTGEQAINRQAASNGSLYTPNTLSALGTFAGGVASQQYNNYVQQLFGAAGLGGQATAGTANAALQTGNNISQAALISGSANASGILGSAGAWQGAIGANTNGNGLSNPNLNWNNLFGTSNPGYGQPTPGFDGTAPGSDLQ